MVDLPTVTMVEVKGFKPMAKKLLGDQARKVRVMEVAATHSYTNSGKPGIVLFSINYILTFRAGFDQMKS